MWFDIANNPKKIVRFKSFTATMTHVMHMQGMRLRRTLYTYTLFIVIQDYILVELSNSHSNNEDNNNNFLVFPFF